MPRTAVDELDLEMESAAEAILADGNKAQLETYGCSFEWFGKRDETQVVTNESEFGLVGTMLLAGRRLTIDYEHKTIELS